LEHIEGKLGLHVGERIVRIRNAVAVFLAQTGIENRNDAVGAKAVTVVVRCVMGERADGESVLRNVFCISQESQNEIAAADVVCQIAKKGAAVGVVAHVLNDGAAVGVGLRPAQILLRGLREFFQEQRLDVCFPNRVNNCFMREHSVSVNGSGGGQRQQNGD
jgi:hypothetical protein